MTDILERLRRGNYPWDMEAADEIRRLRAALDEQVGAMTDMDIERLRALFEDHYWDSLEHVKHIVMAHVEAVLAMAALDEQVAQ